MARTLFGHKRKARPLPAGAGGGSLGGSAKETAQRLKAQAAVRSAGVVVGRVESITFDDKSYQARVTLLLQDRYAFPKDSSLKILTSGLLGEQYIGIEAGADEAHLVPGDTVVATQSALVLENLISQFLFSKAAEGTAPEDNKK